jgi:GH35 family endo-1,4-beta-xylanase
MKSKKVSVFYLMLGISVCLHSPVLAQPFTQLDQLWNDPRIEGRIREGIEQNRKGDFTLEILDKAGKPVKNAEVQVEQTSHEFLFGANIFMLKGYPTEAENAKYEAAFTRLFNFASVPFYWSTLEPEPGKIRYAANSPRIYRRPPPDVVVEFCKKHNITMKGHTLVWDSPTASMPQWAPKNEEELKNALSRRIEGIASRYRDDIRYWDVANEAVHRKLNVFMPHDYVFWAFEQANKHFPPGAHLIYNEVPEIFLENKGEYSHLYLLLQNLLLRGARIDGFGLQFHFFPHIIKGDIPAGISRGEYFSPAPVLAILDLYGRFGKPLNISEITFPALPAGAEGLAFQAKLTRNYYRLFFSHPMMEAITWWNVPDGAAFGSEGNLRGGLLDEKLNRKPAYEELDKLINQEWKTNTTLKTGSDGTGRFRGFYGDYRVTVRHRGKAHTQVVACGKKDPDKITVRL